MGIDGSKEILLQYPLAGIIVVVIGLFLVFLKDWAKAERESRATESAADRESRSKEQSAMRDFIAVQNELFLESLRQIREQNNQAMGRLADEIKSARADLAQMNGLMLSHDAASQARGEIAAPSIRRKQ